MQAVLLGWRMYDLTHDPLHLGLIGLTEAIPALSLALYAGYLVDRRAPLKIYRWVVALSLLSATIMVVSQLPVLPLTPALQAQALYLAAFATGLGRAFAQPSVYAIVPQLVPRAQLARAAAAMAAALQAARIGGPAVGGLLFGWLGIGPSGALVWLLLVLALLVLRGIGPLPRGAPLAAAGSPLQELLAGARFVFKHPVLLPAMLLDMLSVLFAGVTALLPIFAAEILRVGPSGLGLLRAAPAIGAALTSLWLARIDIGPRAGAWLFGAVTGFGVCILGFGLSQTLWLSLLLLAISGACDSVSMVIRSAAVQLASPEALRGRISAVNAIFIGSSNELGEFESGLAAWWLGATAAVVGGGAVCLLTVAVVALMAPALRRLDLQVEP